MLLSVIVPVYNVEKYVSRCLNSLLDQDLDKKEYEILVVNDGATDRSPEIVEGFVREHENIIMISQPNQGLSAARNTGIGKATGKYIYFVDSDDYIAVNTLGSLLHTLESKQLEVIGFSHTLVGPDEFLKNSRSQSHENKTTNVVSAQEYLASKHYSNNVWWYILNTNFLRKTNMLFEVGRFVEDAIFTANVMAAAKRMVYTDLDVYRYVQRPGSIMHTKSKSHTHKLVQDYERVVFGLEELKNKLKAEGILQTGFKNKLINRQQSFVFFLIGRLIRSEVPMKPLLPETLKRVKAINMYPMNQFLSTDYSGLQYKILTFIFNREYLIYPFARIFRLFYKFKK